METIGKRIKYIREQNQLSQKQLANKLNMGDSAISYIESGRRNLSKKRFHIFCSLFSISPEWLTTGQGEMHTQEAEKSKAQ